MSGKKLYRLVGVSLGLLCILQAALNISLRLALYSSGAPDYDAVIRNLTEERDQLKRKLNTFDHHTQEGWVYFRSSFYFISSDKKSWGDSRDDCLQKGADLVIINSKEENEFTRQFTRSFWIGLTDNETEGTWKWVDGTLLNATTSYWHPGEPNSYENNIGVVANEDCGETMFNDFKDNWNDEQCSELNIWICEKSVA
ncbi:unnamed protein product [Pleuronectes platessa]|uniref:C-type lectin domain-containing protein n=1 Tax=Pleuronectes platessa TaxID=8262 RepID=A0A9N7YFG1_PLEPL|nr:unnamed protein product [Pleuronectes platessa]CAB1443248.1 unnamed protein product [Pleuronectes platessa]